jgi:acetoin utilization protein AcuB
MFVRSWMSGPALVTTPGRSAAGAGEFMRKRGVRRLPVVEDGRLVGMLTLSDVAGLDKEDPRTVGQRMAAKPVSVDRDETLETAAQIMIRSKVSGLPVMDGDRVVGVITESDLFRALCAMLGIGEKGARVALAVSDDQDLLEAIRSKVGTLAVRSLVTVHDSKRGQWDVVARVRGRVAAKVR